MSIEVITGQTAKVNDIRFRDSTAMGDQCLTNLQIFEVLAEWVNIFLNLFRAGLNSLVIAVSVVGLP